ncbi:Protein bir1 [Colletotrichum siamense]|uniref:Protein bir1 n=1 Tax=Colletotrichum siamense TaxID=690259 RepID=A0A9P5K5B9_COLSI|nr:Protein bir1 [Colletotrichum siamense]KAF4858739.1 Protein bir1 [Colletotrichum siamense]
MSFEGLVPAEFFTFEGRLASFKQSFPQPKRRASGAGKGASKNLTWPHAKYLLPEDLAKAGFVWRPFPENPDNVACFLCNKSLDGWEEGDNALEEHIKHAPNCGWAIVAGIEANVGDLASEDPSSARMINARKETFGGRWPHDGKRGWKCKTKQLAEAGWKYTPSLEYDDMATCTYCDLALDGWEQGDKPWDEHNNRSPECPFFALVEQYGTTKKPKAKAARGSKTTARLSVQSVATAASDITTLTDAPAEVDDSVLTTASMPGKKGSRAKKATTTAKGRKTKAKKDEPVEVVESEPMESEEPAPPPPKPARGRKRTSDEADESAMTVSEAPAPKKRAPRGRKAAADSSVIDQSQQDISIADAPAPAKAPKGRKTARASGTKGTRKASGQSLKSTASTASLRAAPGAFPEEDDEIQRQLEADLERPLTDDEDIMQDSDSERQKVPAPKPKTKKAHVPQDEAASPERADSHMFDAEPYVADEAAVDEELKQLEAEMTIDEPEVLEVPKKGRKAAGPRKVSKQTKAQKAKAAPVPVEEDELSMAVEPEAPAGPAQPEEPVDPEEDEISTATVITTTTKNARMSTSSRTSTGSTGRKRGRPSKKSLELRASLEASKTEEVDMVEPEMAEPEAEPEPVAEPEVEHEEVIEPEPEVESEPEVEPEAEIEAEEVPEQHEEEADEVDEVSARQSFASARQTPAPAEPQEDEAEDEDEPQVEREEEEQEEEEEEEPESEAPEPTPQPKQQPKKKSIPPASSSPVVAAPSTRRSLQQQTAAPRISPAQSARQPAVSPSPSPQSSDAENQPPSSRSATAKKRVMQAPSSTPARPNSPTKRKVLASLQSTTPWNPVDIDLIFGSPEKSDKRNAVDRLLHKGMELTSPEKRMTVEEWIHFNANQAEERLRQECEAMVSKFENEGTKAMNVLEGLVAE